MPNRYRVTGPKGRPIIKHGTLARVRAALPALVKRFKRINVTTAAAAAPDYRGRLVKLARELIAHEPQVHYAELRPMRSVHLLEPVFPMTMDCSESVTCLYKWAGLPDPNGAGYNGSGYTGTLLAHGRAVALSRAKPGDLVIFGGGNGHHVCMVLAGGPDPLLFSHGQERGPIAIRFSAEQRAQPHPHSCRSYLD